ncbi:cell envelope biogenesis protein OmpA [Muriicola sp.]|uniref:cell envelope biogenesis protein OmpA n=1 Tax=Muriicola sp. TaxID=2020856 RepID=UPI003C78DEBB
MKNFTLYSKTVVGGLLLMLCTTSLAQEQRTSNKNTAKSIEADKRIDDYLSLSKLGYTEKEIFEDLGNANFLAEKYDAAAFWYQKLLDLSGTDAISPNYMDRYKVAMHKAGKANYGNEIVHADWHSQIKEEYTTNKGYSRKDFNPEFAKNEIRPQFSEDEWSSSMEALYKLAGLTYKEVDFPAPNSGLKGQAYTPPITVSADRKTAFFSKTTLVKPEYGIFSKKELVHKIYKAENINGKWMNVAELGICPKYASAMHPAISPDGQRLFFASDMPGSYGNYDIYVARIYKDGRVGIAKNLGDKVNTKKNELYPNLIGGDLLFFASNGREGYGGLDVYAVQVGERKVGMALNVGTPFNSQHDDYALSLKTEQGLAMVMSNRGDKASEAQQLVFSVSEVQKNNQTTDKKNNFLELLPMDPNSIYTNIYYQD